MFKCRDLRTLDNTSEFQQKRRFGLRKPLFYPLNYGDNNIFDFTFLIADCKQWSVVRALMPMFEIEIKSLRFLLSLLPDSI